MKKTLTLELTRRQYQQLVECFFAGSIVMDGHYPEPEAIVGMYTKIFSQAEKFNSADFVEEMDGELKGNFSPSQFVEERVLPILFGEG